MPRLALNCASQYPAAMGIASNISADGMAEAISDDWHASLAALAWQIDLGLTDISAEAPLNRYALPEPIKAPPPPAQIDLPPRNAAPLPAPELQTANPEQALQAARDAAATAQTLEDLHQALKAYDHCDLKRGARNLVFADGNPKARVLILTEAPETDEDREGRPFSTRNAQMLDAMFAAIGLSRASEDRAKAVYIIPALPWRTPTNREPDPAEIAKLRPFLERHITLINPEVIVLMGNAPLQCLTKTTGILRARGQWGTALGKPTLAMTHPSHLLRTPAAKREAWADLLSLQAKLRG
jgi:uracil-DNA glycosylase family 4